MKLFNLVAASSVALFSFNACSERRADELIMVDFESGLESTKVISRNASFELIEEAGNHLLRVNTEAVFGSPGITIHGPENQTWNLGGYSRVLADVRNTVKMSAQVQLFVGNDPDARARRQCSNYVDLNPGETKTVTVKLSWTPWVFDPQLEIVGMRGIPGKVKTDLDEINEIAFCARYPAAACEFTIDNVRATQKLEYRDPAGFFPFIDEFGQYIHRDWKGKNHSMMSGS